MKNPQLILSALVMFHFGCEPQEDVRPVPAPDINYHQISNGFQEMFEGAFKMSESLELISVVDHSPKQISIRLEASHIQDAAQKHISNFFSGSTYFTKQKSHLQNALSLRFSGQSRFSIMNKVIDTTEVFSDVQKLLVRNYSKDMLVAKSYQEGYNVVLKFKDKIMNTTELTSSEKLELLQIAAGSHALIQYFEADRLELLRNNFANTLGESIPVGKIAGCTVDWRGAWMDGIIGLTLGAASGFYAGATGGTIVMPVVGTVTGAVNGAVIGGAIGFTSGVLQGIASDLFLSCSRNTEPQLALSFASCELAREAYYNNEINQIPLGCFQVKFTL
jgi:hypothetical protein